MLPLPPSLVVLLMLLLPCHSLLKPCRRRRCDIAVDFVSERIIVSTLDLASSFMLIAMDEKEEKVVPLMGRRGCLLGDLCPPLGLNWIVRNCTDQRVQRYQLE